MLMNSIVRLSALSCCGRRRVGGPSLPSRLVRLPPEQDRVASSCCERHSGLHDQQHDGLREGLRDQQHNGGLHGHAAQPISARRRPPRPAASTASRVCAAILQPRKRPKDRTSERGEICYVSSPRRSTAAKWRSSMPVVRSMYTPTTLSVRPIRRRDSLLQAPAALLRRGALPKRAEIPAHEPRQEWCKTCCCGEPWKPSGPPLQRVS